MLPRRPRARSRPGPVGLALAALLWVLLGPATPAPAQADRPVVEIRFEGVNQERVPLLREQIRTRVGEPFDRRTLDEDVRRLAGLGEFDADVRAEARTEEDGIHVTFHLSGRDLVRRVEVEGVENVTYEDVQDALLSRPGSYLSPYFLSADREAIRDLYARNGYLHAEVTSRILPVEGGVEVWHRVVEGPWVWVEDLAFVGNETFSPSRLDDFMETRARTGPLGILRSGQLDLDLLDEDLGRVETFYRSRGYLDARVFLEDIRFDPADGGTAVRIGVVEGQRYSVRSIAVEGVRLFEPDEIRDVMRLEEGAPFRMDHLDADRQAIVRMYGEQGYIFANVEVDVGYLEDRTALDLTLTVTEGQKIYLDRIEIRGNERTRDDVIRRDLSLYPGGAFNSELLTESRERLGRRGYFQNVTIDFAEGTAPNRRDLVLGVEEQPTGNILFGAGFSSDLGFFGRIQITQRNFDIADLPTSLADFLSGTAFVGGGQRMNIRLEPGRQRSLYSVRFTEPWLFGYPYSLSTNFFWFTRDWRDYQEGRLGGRIGLGKRFARDMVGRLSYQLREVTIFDIDRDALADVVRVAGDHLVSGVELGLDLDRNVLAINRLAYRGWGANVSWETLGGPFGGDVDLNRITLEGNVQATLFHFPPPDPFTEEALTAAGSAITLQARGQAGWQEEFGRSSEVPIFERFFTGGPRSVRGFEFRSVGPQDDDEPTGGEHFYHGTLELNVPVPTIGEFLRAVAFVDAGTVTRDLDDLFDGDRSRVAAGAGARIYVPQFFPAPIALDFGFPIRDRATDDRETFSFSIDAGF